MVKIGGNDDDLDLILQLFIKGDTPNEVDIRVGGIVDHLGSIGDVLQIDIGRNEEVDDNAAGTVDGGFQQRRGDGHAGGFLGLIGAAGGAQAHVGIAGVLHDGGDIGEV